MNLTVSAITALASLLLDLGGRRKAYMQWRMSEEGQKHFKKLDNAKFFRALVEGDTAVIDVAIKEKQDKIKKLKRELGLGVLVCMLLLPVGCTTYSIPDGIPDATAGALQEDERTYVVNNMTLNVPSLGKKTLRGQWHVVNPDFIRAHVSNQDDLILALTELKKARRQATAAGATALASIACLLLVLYLKLKR